MSSGAGSPDEPTADLPRGTPAGGPPPGGDYSGVIGGADADAEADALRAMAGAFGRRAGQRIAGFELVDRIDKDANNAFGEVWLARRVEPFQRVAIKFLRRDRVNDELVRRFSRAESKALARFNHPYIARFYELGFDGDTPYLVMQYVPGDRLTAYCDKHGLSMRERLELMAKVCDAVQHVHLQGVVHRDLKPANILVSEARPEAEDARDAKEAPGAGDGVAAGKAPIPVLIDFGLAKSVNPDAPLASQVVSGIGSFAGTYAYAAPEQIKQRRDEDTGRQADIYALGAVLFELIVGASPMEHVLSDATLSDPERNLRLANDERPSMAAAYARLAPERQREVAAQRGTTVEAMKRLLRSRLAHLADRALRAKPAARFTDARAFALDIANYLADRDFVEAAAEPRLEKWRRAVRRNRVAFAGVAGVIVALTAGVVATSIALKWANDAAHAAVVARASEQERAAELERKNREVDYNSYVANMQMAYQSMRNGLYKRVRDRLDACPEHLRGWEWRHLDAVSDSSLVVLGNPVRKIVCADWSPDGTRVVTGAKDGSVEVWNADTGERLWVASASVASETVTTPGTPDQVMAVSWSQNGKRILSVSERGSLGVFDAATGRRQVSVEVPCVDQSFVSAALSPDGTRIAVATFGIPLRILDAESGALVVELTDGGGSDSTWDWFKTFWSPDGTKLVSLSHDGAVLWDSLAGRRIADFKLGVVLQGCFSQDGGWVAFASSSQGILSVRNARTGEKRQDVPIGQKLFACSSVDFNPTGTQVLATFDYGVVGVWSLATDVGDAGELSPARDARPSLELSGELGAIASAAYSPDGTRIVTASDDGTARIWDARFGGEIAQLKGHTAGVLSARFSPNGTRVLTTSQDGSARIWSTTASELVLAQSMRLERESIATSASAIFTDRDEQIIAAWSCDGVAELRTYDSLLGEMISRFQPHDRLKSIEATLYGRRLLTALDQRVDVCDVLSGEVLFSLEHGQPVVGVRACLDETRVVTWSGFGPAKVWSMDTGDLLSSLGTEGGSSSFAVLSPDGSRALTASHDKVARLWTAAAGRLIHQLVGHKDWICAMEFSPDGRMALTGDEKGRVFVWDTESGGLHFALQGHTKAITAATFCRQNGRRILTASEDGSARLWDAASGRCIAELLGHDGPVSDAEFSPDDSRVATASEDGGIRIWDPATGQLLADWFVGSGSLDGSPSGVQTRAEGRRAARGVASVSFSADGSRLVASVRDGTARVYDAVPYRQKHEVVESRQAVWREARRVVEAQLSAGKSIETIRQAELSSWEPASAEKSAKLSAVMGLVDERESLLRQFASLSNQWILVDGTEPRAQLERNARRLLRIAGGDAESLAMAGVALYRLDRFEDSILALSRARDSRSGPGAPNPRDLAVLAMCYWKLGEFAKAREEARHVRRLSNEEDWESKPWVQEMVWEMNEMIPLE